MCQCDMSQTNAETSRMGQSTQANEKPLDKKEKEIPKSDAGISREMLRTEQFRGVEFSNTVKRNPTPEEKRKETENRKVMSKLIDGLCDEAMYMVRKFILDAEMQGTYEGEQEKAEKLFESIKVAFFQTNTIECILGKTFSLTTGANLQKTKEDLLYSNEIQIENMKEVAASLKEPIEQTLNDILYWGVHYNQSAVSEIFLTDSDMHARGVGVCIVTYEFDSGRKKIVIKPEDKSFEKMVYGKEKAGEEKSLASLYNENILEKGKIKFVKNNGEEVSLKKGTIGRIGIDVSNHGSAVEYYKHDELEKGKDKKVNETSVMALVPFASLLGMADLHRENAVYGGKDRKNIQIIDGETAMKYDLDEEKPLNSVIWNGEMGLGAAPSIPQKLTSKLDTGEFQYDMLAMKQFLGQIEDKFNGKRSRIVPLATGAFYKMRTAAYGGVLSKESYFNNFEEGGLFRTLIEIYGIRNIKSMIEAPDNLFEKTKADYLKGRIPFFEYDFSQGAIYQKFSDGTEMLFLQYDELKLERMIARRKYTLNPETAMNEFTDFLETTFGKP